MQEFVKSKIKVFYGNIDITSKLNKEITYLSNDNNVLDKRFGDPMPGVKKYITINNIQYMTDVYVNLVEQKVYTQPPNVIPITFSFPKEKMIDINDLSILIKKKDKILSSLIPGDTSTYIYTNEKDYYDEYKRSYFAITKKKAGWDCMRHYEIIANGCIPVFENIEYCPKNTMTLFNKELQKESNQFYKNIKDIDNEKWSQLMKKHLIYMSDYLTTEKIAQYILNKTNQTHVKKILYLSGSLYSDYLRCLCMHGFKQLIGKECHDYPKVPHMYKNHNIPMGNMWGKGFTYNGLLENELHDDEYDKTIEKDIKNKKYDIIIYGSLHRGLPYYELCNEYYKPNEIIFLCGEDEHICNSQLFIEKGHYLFVREMN
jgi:hypothetical protein